VVNEALGDEAEVGVALSHQLRETNPWVCSYLQTFGTVLGIVIDCCGMTDFPLCLKPRPFRAVSSTRRRDTLELQQSHC
jgi:hypothetical protein